MENIEVLLEHLDGMWGAAQMYCGDDAYGDGYRAIRAALVEGQKPSTNTQMAAALWRELKRRQSNGLVPLRVDWVAVTEKRLNAAVAALRHS